MVHFNIPRDWFERNSRHQNRYSEEDKKFRGCLLGRVVIANYTPLSLRQLKQNRWISGLFINYRLTHSASELRPRVVLKFLVHCWLSHAGKSR